MKIFLSIIIFSLILSTSLEAQKKSSKINSKPKSKKALVDTSKVSVKNIDTCSNPNNKDCKKMNGDGKCRMKDQFIDKDGDGINDNRCSGMGFGCGKGKGNCYGKKKIK